MAYLHRARCPREKPYGLVKHLNEGIVPMARTEPVCVHPLAVCSPSSHILFLIAGGLTGDNVHVAGARWGRRNVHVPTRSAARRLT